MILIISIFCVFFVNLCDGLEGYELPIVPEELQKLVESKAHKKIEGTNKYIPQLGWVAVRNISEERAAHMLGPSGFLSRNSNWRISFHDNDMKDKFMEDYYANSSILWAYNILNPVIGTSKVEIWRLAVLYLYGGMYMDDDASLGVPLDEIVQPDDKFIVGKEGYDFDDRCYKPEFPLSNDSMNTRFGLEANNQIFFNNRFFFNWALFSMPGNPFIFRVMKYIVDLLRQEYFSDSMVKLSPMDHRGKLLMCCTTYPITHVAKEMLLEGRQAEIGLRVGGEMFVEYQGNIKAWNNDWRPDRWVKQIHKHRIPYLRYWAPPRVEIYEGKLIQAKGQREIYLVQGLRRKVFPNFGTFVNMNFTLEDVNMVRPEVVDAIKPGPMLPSLD